MEGAHDFVLYEWFDSTRLMEMAKDPTTLADLHPIFEEAFNRGDVDGLVALYENNATLISATGHRAVGKEQIRAAIRDYLRGQARIQIQTTSIFEADGLGLTTGKWQITGTGSDGKPLALSGSGAEVLRRQADGCWLYVIDSPFTG